MSISICKMVCVRGKSYYIPTLLKHAFRAAELLNSIASQHPGYGSDTDVDSPMSDVDGQAQPRSSSAKDPLEARLEARERHKYLLAKTYFDCREYDRCAAVFLPPTLPRGHTPSSPAQSTKSQSKGKAKVTTPVKGTKAAPPDDVLLGLSQKSLFLALYAKYMSGEKRKDEESEMILGPADGGVTMNRELGILSSILEDWLSNSKRRGGQSQGWLEYLYGIVLAKGKNEAAAIAWFIKSVHLYPYNWGAWQELSGILGTVEEVRFDI